MDLSATIRYLGELLGQAISEQESPALFDTEERIRALAKARRAGDDAAAAQLAEQVAALAIDQARAVASAFTLYFDLANLAEEAQRVDALRERERAQHPAPIGESIAEAIGTLKQRGVSSEQMARLLRDLRIELVLTAHPTEAKRRTILSKLQRISGILHALNETNPLPREREAYSDAIRAEITSLWLTHRARTRRPAVTDEVRTGLYFVNAILWDALPRIYADLDVALAQFYPDLAAPKRWLTLASWIGGDRDGNPNVTTEVTAETLRLHRGLAVERHRAELQDLSRRLSLDEHRVPPPRELQVWLESRHPLPARVAFLETRYTNEPYRLILSLLASDLEYASQDDMTARLLEDTPHTARLHFSDLAAPLDWIARAVPPRLVQDRLKTVRRQLDIFGLHAVRLDIREDSARLASTLGEILRALNIAADFENLDDVARTRILLGLLAQPGRPASLAKNPGVTADTAETWALFRLLARAIQVYGRELFGPFIISMTRGPADVLTVLLLARWSGSEPNLQIVPLFETLDDLAAAPRVLADLFSLEVYRAHLAASRDEQMVMIGYSDSNKDCGFLAANWALYQAQEQITRVCRERSVRLTLFHGRGGTVARGGGPANRAIRAQPPGTVNGRFRVTEQGETIVSRYSDPELAHRHLEQITSAVILASVPSDESREQVGSNFDTRRSSLATRPEWRAAMDAMSAVARDAYRALVYATPGFIDFWLAATPLDEINRLSIGSRPATRASDGLQITRIRAIPWVFSWMQARFNLPSWYGLGTALSRQPLALLQEMYAAWQFFRALLDNTEMSLLKADIDIAALYAALYAALAPEREQAESIFRQIRVEYDLTRRIVLQITQHSELMEEDAVIQHSVQLRNPYVDPLNYIQVEMLKRLRALPDQNGAEADALREVISITINGIAAGLRNTG